LPALEGHAPGDDAIEPAALGARQRPRRVFVMPAIRVYRAEDDTVLEHHRLVERGDVERGAMLLAAEAGEADDAARCGAGDRLRDDLRRAGSFDDDVELHARLLGVMRRAQRAQEL